ncbi:MAG: hypothetical protein QM726_05340 [Chitinophagaceae bacterium]
MRILAYLSFAIAFTLIQRKYANEKFQTVSLSVLRNLRILSVHFMQQ